MADSGGARRPVALEVRGLSERDPGAARRFAELTEACHALTSTPTPAIVSSPGPSSTSAPLRRPVPVAVRFTRPTIIAGPAYVVAASATSRRSA